MTTPLGVTHSEVAVVASCLPMCPNDAAGWRPTIGGLVSATLAATDVGAVTPVHIDDVTVADAVAGMADSVLWPALHGLPSRIRERLHYAPAYRRLNQAFADRIIAGITPGSAVWVHDYHLLLVPGQVGAARPDLTICQSLSTPFDDGAVSNLAIAPELATALAHSDLVIVQTAADADRLTAFMVTMGTQAVPEILVSPTSIDPREIVDAMPLHTDDTGTSHESTGPLIVGVDRLDATAGVIERIAAFDLAFRTGMICPDDVRLVQISHIDHTAPVGYNGLRLDVERAAHALNARWPRNDGSPVLDLRIETCNRADVLALLAEADVAMVTPVRDGMSLLAKEYSIAAEHRGGVLVLSDTSGAAVELGLVSILVDGSRPESVAAGLQAALRLDVDTRRTMAEQRANSVRRWTSADWARSVVTRLAEHRDLHGRRRFGPVGDPTRSDGVALHTVCDW